MENEKISQFFNEFIKSYDKEKTLVVWNEKSKQFRDFWNGCILNEEKKLLNESEVDQIIRILDRKAKGNTKNDVAVANVMIPQGVWRRMFNEIKQNKELQEILNNIFVSEDDKIQSFIDKLYKVNEGKKNSLTGKSANAINTMLFAFSPQKYLAVVSLNDRKKVIDFFKFENGPDFEKDNIGKKVFFSNKAIIEGFKNLGIEATPRIISEFLYLSLKDYWKKDEEEIDESSLQIEEYGEDKSLFYMEKELENFIITNWDKTELGKDYDLIEEDGEVVSQQYSTDIGKIDILARDKKTKQYVVIELKRNQTSDDTIGQLTRYMGWIEEKKSPEKSAKGIIIAAKYDDRLYYALKKVKDVEIYLYQVDFKLKEFKR